MLRQSQSGQLQHREQQLHASDYNSINLVVTFQPGTVTRTFDVAIVGDTNLELNETFLVNLTESFGTTIADGEGVCTILDDDILLVLEELGPVSRAGSSTRVVVTYKRSVPSREYRRLV